MPRRVALLAALPALLGPAAIAFFSGGYFDEARLWAGVAAWVLVAAIALADPRLLVPPSAPGRLAVAALAAFTAWTGLSLLWAPVAGPAVDGLQVALLYLGALPAAIALLRPPVVRSMVEPALLAGIAVVAAYALGERVLPSGLTYHVSAAAGNRLNQPLTYWNGLGAVCAIGLVLAAGIAASRTRAAPLRMAAAAAAPPIGLALYLTFSRGALAAAAGGLAVLVAIAPSRRTLASAALVAAAAAVPALATIVLPDVKAPGGSQAQGAAMLAVLVASMAAAALLTHRLRLSGAPGPRLRIAAVTGIAAVAVALLAVALSAERRPADLPQGATAGRLASAESNRYEYWKVALRSWADHPLEGVGSGGFATEWRRERTIAESVRDAHSLYIETAAELGLVGLLLLAGLVAGAVGCAVRAGPESAAATAALAAFGLHAGLDWDWEMPAVTLLAVVLLASLSVRSGSAAAAPPPSPRPAT